MSLSVSYLFILIQTIFLIKVNTDIPQAQIIPGIHHRVAFFLDEKASRSER